MSKQKQPRSSRDCLQCLSINFYRLKYLESASMEIMDRLTDDYALAKFSAAKSQFTNCSKKFLMKAGRAFL